jgi:hypothetical protein
MECSCDTDHNSYFLIFYSHIKCELCEFTFSDGSTSLSRSATPLSSTRSKSRDLSSSRSSAFGETENHEVVLILY